jgi:hypothetical protein
MFDRAARVGGDLRLLSLGQLGLRVVILVAPLVCTGVTFAAASDWIVWVLLVVLAASIECALHAESNLGFAVILVLALHWLATVDDRSTPYTLAAALAIAVFHTAMAAAGVAAPSARWTSAMWGRWGRRLGCVVLITVAAWLVELSLRTTDLAGSAIVLGAALIALTVAALALRARSLSSEPR